MAAHSALITGAAGFLGSHLTDRLLRDGYRVVGVDNLSTGDQANIADAQKNSAFHFIEADVSLPWNFTSSLVPPFAPTLILHFASPASPVHYGNDPLGTMAVNAIGTMHACALARELEARVLIASTSESYGDPLEHPQPETYWGNVNPIGERACYDESKRFAEAYLTSAVRKWGIDGRLVRIFNTYGPRMQPDDGRVIPNFCMSALRGEPLTIYGDGTQTRSFCFVDDLVDGIMRLAMRDGLNGRVVNIGNPSEFSMHELARIVVDLAGVELKTSTRGLPPDDPTRRRPDITLARDLLGWQPTIDLRTGLQPTLLYFAKRSGRTAN